MKDEVKLVAPMRVKFQSPFGITACESKTQNGEVKIEFDRFNRLSASLHVKGKRDTKPLLIDSCFNRLSASLHVKVKPAPGDVPQWIKFQSPFGITACERPSGRQHSSGADRFNRLSASLHVKAGESPRFAFSFLFQSPFGITACERQSLQRMPPNRGVVSNAFRHHCM